MANKLLFVFEGQTTEKDILNSLTKFHLNENTVIHCAFCQDIYFLFDQLQQDEDLDLFMLLKEKPINKCLQGFGRDDFAEIYLFFDYDGHATKADDEKLKNLLELFNNETEIGKLYISYPMVEAYKHLHPEINFENVFVPAKENIQYKALVHKECHKDFGQNTSKLSDESWSNIIRAHLKKMNFIIHDSFELPQNLIPQNEVFDQQLKKYIQPTSTVGVLSAFPPMLLDYYGISTLYKKLKEYI